MSKLNKKNIIEARKAGTVSLIEYGYRIVDWTKSDKRNLDRNNREAIYNVWTSASEKMILTGCNGRETTLKVIELL